MTTLLIVAAVILLVIVFCVVASDKTPDGSNRIRAIPLDLAPNAKKIVQYKCRIGWANLERGPFPGTHETAIFTDMDTAKRFAETVRQYGILQWTGRDERGRRSRREMEFAEAMERMKAYEEVEL